jgi:hypothetical protein
MKTGKRMGGLAAALVVLILCVIGLAQVEITLPGMQPGGSSGDAINFGAVHVGTTATATYTYKLLETSATSATVTISRPNAPFGSNAPTGSFTLAPGQSRTFNVTFSPTAVGNFTGSFTITAQGGYPVQVKRQTVTLTGQGVITPEDLYPPPISTDETPIPSGTTITPTPDTTEDIAKLEAKLDRLEAALNEFRQKLDGLGWWLGKLTVGYPIGIEPYSTNPMPETDLWRLLASLEAKLDRLSQRPTETTGPEIDVTIIEIYNILVEINQLIINFGSDVDGIEAKLDRLSSDLFDLWLDLMDMWDDLNDMRTDLDDMWDDMSDRFDDVEDAIAANANAIRALQASNARIEDKLNQLLGLPAMPTSGLITLTVSPATISASDHTATLEGDAGAVEGGVTVNVYWLGIDSWRPGVTDPFYFDTLTARPDGSFSLTKDGWRNAWPQWCEITQATGSGESAPVRIYNSTLMIGM